MTERAFRNAVALSLLLIGLALVAFAIGGVLAFAADAGGLGVQGEQLYDSLFGVAALTVALLFFVIGLSLIRSRPQQRAADDAPVRSWRSPGPAALRAARTFGIVLFVLGLMLLFDDAPSGRDTMTAAVLILGGVFGVAGTIMYAKADANVAAVGGVLGVIAGAMLLYGQLAARLPDGTSGTYGAWETTNLVVPPVLGPIAIMVASGCGVAYAYARAPRAALLCFIGLGVAALVYGIGLCLVGLAAVLDVPFYDVSGADDSTLQLLATVAGTALLVAGGVACVVAALIGFVRTARALQDAAPSEVPREVVGRTSRGHPLAAEPSTRVEADDEWRRTRAA